MNIPFLSLKDATALHGDELNEAVHRVVDADWYLQRWGNEKFERNNAQFIGITSTHHKQTMASALRMNRMELTRRYPQKRHCCQKGIPSMNALRTSIHHSASKWIYIQSLNSLEDGSI